jgi:DNA-binding Lrp family transcriptional regulator
VVSDQRLVEVLAVAASQAEAAAMVGISAAAVSKRLRRWRAKGASA